MDIWSGFSYLAKILCCTILTSLREIEVKVLLVYSVCFFQLGIQQSDFKSSKGLKTSQSKNISEQITEVTIPTPLNLFSRSHFDGMWLEGSLNESFTQSISWDRSDSNISVSYPP